MESAREALQKAFQFLIGRLKAPVWGRRRVEERCVSIPYRKAESGTIYSANSTTTLVVSIPYRKAESALLEMFDKAEDH